MISTRKAATHLNYSNITGVYRNSFCDRIFYSLIAQITRHCLDSGIFKPIEVDEDTSINAEILHFYSKHRLELETIIQNQFDALVVRLPSLFGKGMKKNIIYDFLYNNLLGKINKGSVFQFYNLEHLWHDIQVAIKHDLKVVNFATEPTSVAEVATTFDFEFTQTQNTVKYDIRTKYYQLFDGIQPGYLYNKNQVLLELKEFVTDCKNSNSAIPQLVLPDEC